MEKKVKITIVGIGGVGGYLSGMLAKTYENVTLVARGERKNLWKKKAFVCIASITEKSRPERKKWWKAERRYGKYRILFFFV